MLAGFEAIRTAWTDEERRIRAVVDRLGPAGIALPLEYRGFDGRPQAQIFWHMLQHLVNHGSYHRGQVTTMLRQVGAAPIAESAYRFGLNSANQFCTTVMLGTDPSGSGTRRAAMNRSPSPSG
jgi:uncharacterized damage-inducible protein DinB